ncbi:L-2-hydroxyglutarate dehydrogenase, mitochondrial [Novymonas esmeraldas]|uniref:L-2-hydroxyglutarate dehydrogenase, mitochondrial n=1 Tax=Novymonas esmeraldas TaxID=1808958 RepID=A0AAW0EJX6_9TRYP
MPSLGRLFSGVCQVAVVGGLAGAVYYRRQYGELPTDGVSTAHSLTTYSKNDRRDVYDVAIVGGGIVGVATAREIRQRHPSKRVILIEREADVAQHQSGHNSGCIHAGMFYPPGSAMARLCPRGHGLIIDYCEKNKLPYELCGKIIVAAKDSERPEVQRMYDWGTANGVKGLEILEGEEAIKKKEPLVTGVSALWSPVTGIIDFAEVTRCMLRELTANAKNNFTAQFQFDAQDFVGVSVPKSQGAGSDEMVLIRGREHGHLGPEKTVLAKSVITCCGLSNDVVAKHSGGIVEWVGKRVVQTYGFRGRYYQLTPECRDMVHMHVYPCPDNSKGLSVGVHFTPTVDMRRGRQVIVGPGSAVALDRFGYTPYTIDLEYCFNCAFSKGGLVSLASNFGVICQTYYMDLSKRKFLREAQKLIPSIEAKDIEESFCGVMAIGVVEDGTLSMDLAMEFARPRVVVHATMDKNKILETIEAAPHAGKEMEAAGSAQPLILNVRNAPSPAATASMAIAEDIVRAASSRFHW